MLSHLLLPLFSLAHLSPSFFPRRPPPSSFPFPTNQPQYRPPTFASPPSLPPPPPPPPLPPPPPPPPTDHQRRLQQEGIVETSPSSPNCARAAGSLPPSPSVCECECAGCFLPSSFPSEPPAAISVCASSSSVCLRVCFLSHCLLCPPPSIRRFFELCWSSATDLTQTIPPIRLL